MRKQRVVNVGKDVGAIYLMIIAPRNVFGSVKPSCFEL